MSYTPKSAEDYKEQLVEQMRDGIVKIERESYLFDEEEDVYILSGSSETARVLFIDAVEGMNLSGSWVPPEGTYNDVAAWTRADWTVGEGIPEPTEGDYILYWTGSELTTPEDSAYPNYPLYQAIRWINPDTKPKHDTSFFIDYRYYDAQLISGLTNFRAGGVANSLVEAISISLSNIDNNNYYLFINNFLRFATGESLDHLAYPWGLTRNVATKTSGWLAVTAASGAEVHIGAPYRFSTIGRETVFQAKSDYIGTVIDGTSGSTTGHIEIEAIAVGASYNTGPNTILKAWTTDTLITEVSDATVTNYSTHEGATNYFNTGSDEENDEDFRTRIYNAATKQGSATYAAVEAAVEDIAGVVEARVYDIENKPYLAENSFQVFVLGEEKIITDGVLLAEVSNVVSQKKPVGSIFTVYQPNPKYTYLDINFTPDEGYWNNRDAISSRINTNVSNYLSGLGLGDDIVYAEILEQVMDTTGVYSSKINKFYVATWVFSTENDTYPLEYVYDIDSSSGTAYATEFYMGTKSWRQHEVHTSGTTNYPISGSYISSGYANPLVYLTIENESGKWIRNPLYSANYYSTHSSTSITIVEEPPAGSVGRNLSTGDDLVFIYEDFAYSNVIGAIVSLSGTVGDQIELSVWSGSSEPTDKLASGTITLTGTSAQEYFAEFDSTLTLVDVSTTHWLVASGVSTSGSCYVGTNTDGETPDKGESVSYFDGAAWSGTSDGLKAIVMMPIPDTYNAIVDDELWKSEVTLEFGIELTAERKET